MASLTAHLREAGEHGRLGFHPSCPTCRDERLAGRLPSDSLVTLRTQAVLAAGVLACSAAAPTAVLAATGDQEGDGAADSTDVAPDPWSNPESAPASTDVLPGDDGAAPVDQGSEPADADDDTGPVGPDLAETGPAPVDQGAAPEATSAPPAESTPAAKPLAGSQPPVDGSAAPAPDGSTTGQAPAASGQGGVPPATGAAEMSHQTMSHQTAVRDAPRSAADVARATESLMSTAHRHRAEVRVRAGATPDLVQRTLRSGTPTSHVHAVTRVSRSTAAADVQRVARPAVVTHRTRAGHRVHVVLAGESLWSIANDVLGGRASVAQVAREVNRLWTLNGERIATGDPDLLRVGTRLVLE